MESSELREDRLVRVVKRLESKIKTIWDEKKVLAERLELATLDKELAEERYLSLETSLRSESELRSTLEARVTELEELQALSVELEESYIAQKEELATVIQELRKELSAASEKAKCDAQQAEARIHELLTSQTSEQSLETLRQELESTKLKLSASELDLTAQKSGMAAALKPIFIRDVPDLVDMLPFIDYYQLNATLREPFDNFRFGNISSRKLAQAIDVEIDKAENSQKSSEPDWKALLTLLKSVDHTSNHLLKVLRSLQAASESPRVHDLLKLLMGDVDIITVEKLEQEVTELQMQEAEAKSHPQLPHESRGPSDEVETLKLRVRFLDSKLSQARELAAEIDKLKAWQDEARRKETQLQKLVTQAEETIKQKGYEIAKLKRAELPTTLDAAIVQQKLKDMATALQWFSRSQHQRLRLDPLKTRKPFRISLLTGDSRISAMRNAVCNFTLVETHGKSRRAAANGAARVALDQFEMLNRLGCPIE